MPNRYFNNTIDLINNTRARASDVEANFDQIEDGFDTTQAEMDLKANAANSNLTGTPTAPTAAPGTNTTQIATTAFVHAERSNALALTNKTIDLANNTLQATSAQMRAAVTDETGTGALVFATSPALTNPTITGGTISGAVVSGSANINVQRFTGNGVTTVFTLSSNPVSENNTQIYIDGVYQQKDTYSISGTTLTFSEAPDAGLTNPENIEVITTSMQAIGTTTSDLVSYTPSGTGAVATNVQSKLREFVSVKDFGAVGDGVTDDAPAVQLAVNHAISSGVRRVFFPFSQRERYRLASKINIESSGFALIGDVLPRYDPENGGYIFGDAGVTSLFDYGNGRSDLGSTQFVADGLAFYSSTGLTQNAIIFTQNNNGPHRGFLVRNCAGKGFANIVKFDVPTGTNLTVATVDVQSSVFRGNTNVVNTVERAFGLRYVGNQSEQGARITGFWDAGVTIEDNMLEGQTNPINIDSNSPSVTIQNNYFEAVGGDYIARVKGTVNAALDVKPNYVSDILCTDLYRVEGSVRVNEDDMLTDPLGRKAALTLLNGTFTPGSNVSGRAYIGTTTTTGLQGFVDPLRMFGIRPSTAVVKQDLGTEALSTPFGETKTGAVVTGFAATYQSLTATWNAGDVLVCCALVRVQSGEAPYFNIYDEVYGQPGISCGQVGIRPIQDGKWFLMVAAEAASSGGTTCRFRFGTNGTASSPTATSLYVAAVGVHVVPAADFVSFNSVSRAFVQLFNPFVPEKPLEGSKTYDPPSLADGAGTTTTVTVTRAALGDFAEASFDQDLAGITVTAWVSATNTVTVRFQNESGGPLDLASGTLRARVRKL
jgi:hypothetical protein